MGITGVDTKCYILALFIRSDGERFLLGSGNYEFAEKQQHFAANVIANDVVEVQGNDGYLLAGQVRRPGVQSFDGYIGDGNTPKAKVEEYRREFFSFFRKNFLYRVIYVFPDGSAIQRKRGFLVDAPVVQELYQIYPEYHVALNFEDINYYHYNENSDGNEIYGKSAVLGLSVAASGGLVWDLVGAVSLPYTWTEPVEFSGSEVTITNSLGVRAPLESVELEGDTYQQEYSGKNILPNEIASQIYKGVTITRRGDGSLLLNGTSSGGTVRIATITVSEGETLTMSGLVGWQYNTLQMFVNSTVAFPFGHRLQCYNGPRTRTALGDETVSVDLYFYAGQTYSNVEVKPMVERGSTATDYEPYVGGIPSPNPDYPQTVQTVTGVQTVGVSSTGGASQSYTIDLGSIELCKIGDYQDYIYKNGDDWYVHKEVGKTTDAVGSTGITISGMESGGDFYSYCGGAVSDTTITYAGALTVANTIYYQLATPTDTRITDAGLIGQLEALGAMELFAGENNVLVTATGTNLPAVLEGSYPTGIDYDGAGFEWEEGGDGGLKVLTIDSIDNVYPLLTVTGPAVNPTITNVTAGVTFTYTGTVTASQVLKVDMMNKTATLNGTSVIGNVSGDWLYFQPGDNRVEYTTSNAGAPNALIEWQEIVG